MIPRELILDIFLHPEEFYWGEGETRIKTILGSCVAICMWHPTLKIGGMSHSLLPSRQYANSGEPPPHARYVDEAVALFAAEIRRSGTLHRDYKVKIFGGANVVATIDPMVAVGSRNLEMARLELEKNGFTVFSEHAGGTEARNIMLDLWNGETWLKRIG